MRWQAPQLTKEGIYINILVIGGTRYFGVHLVNELLDQGHKVTIATIGIRKDNFGDKLSRISIDRTDADSIKEALSGKHFNVVYDNLAYCSKDVKYLLDVIKCDKYILMSSTAVYEKHWDTKEEGEAAPYNGEVEYSMNVDRAEELGFRFSNLKDWIYGLLDYYMRGGNQL